MCKVNVVFKIHEGSRWGDVDLSNVLVWRSGDLGGDLSGLWEVITFNEGTSRAQQLAFLSWLKEVEPVEFDKIEIREDRISWHDAETAAEATMESGLASISLQKVFGPNGKQTVIRNGRWGGEDSNDGKYLAFSTHEFRGEPAFRFEERHGLMATLTKRGKLTPTDQRQY